MSYTVFDRDAREHVTISNAEYGARQDEFADLPKKCRSLLVRRGWRSRAEVAVAPDSVLLSTYMMGPKLLAEIRQYIPYTPRPKRKLVECPRCHGHGYVVEEGQAGA